MRLRLAYHRTPGTTGLYFERAFRDLTDLQFIGSEGPLEALRESEPIFYDLRALPPGEGEEEAFLFMEGNMGAFPLGLERAPFVTAAYFIDVGPWPEYLEVAAPFFDVVFVAAKYAVDDVRAVVGHDQVHWLPLAVDTDTFHPLPDRTIEYDVGYVGQRGEPGSTRRRRLDLLNERFRMNPPGFTPPEDIADVYARSSIVCNVSVPRGLPMRIFEALACGRPLLTEDTAEAGLRDLFTPGVHLDVYRDDDEMLAKVEHYLKHPEGAAAMAEAGLKEVRENHTYRARARTILDALQGAEKVAPIRTETAPARLARHLEVAARMATFLKRPRALHEMTVRSGLRREAGLAGTARAHMRFAQREAARRFRRRP